MARKRILILTLSFGTGHVVASEAIAQAIRLLDRAAEVRTIDCIQLATWWFRAAYVWTYWMMIRFAPSLWIRLFRARQTRMHQQTAPGWIFRLGCRRVFQQIRAWKPDVLVATEVGACEIASLAKRHQGLTIPLLAVATDHESEPVWLKEEVDQYFVPTPGVAEQLNRWGVDRQKISVSGIPVHSKFFRGTADGEIRDKLKFPNDRPLVLIMGGGMGPLRMDQIVRELSTLPRALSFVAVTGLNAKMQKRLGQLKSQMPPDKSLTIHGWVENVDELMRAADVLVTKPGGITLTEACSVGVPMVCVNPIPGPEQTHCRLIEEEHLGVVARSVNEVCAKVEEIIDGGKPWASRPSPGWLKRDAAKQIAGSALEGVWPPRTQEGNVYYAPPAGPGAVPGKKAPVLLQPLETE
ncbi:MAG: glycosyltransferase [Acidobacteriia bacterium]|nr:glycosyltransferase [Terriglobia bacterium]